MKLQAFIFCGKGQNLSPFSNPNIGVSENDTELNNTNDINLNKFARLPKALLPVAGKPMIEYVIDWCDQADFSEINIVASGDEINLIRTGLKSFLSLRDQQYKLIAKTLSNNSHTHHLKEPIKINFILSKSAFTGELLQNELLDKINGDFVLLPCDFITDIPPQLFLDQYQNRDDSNIAMSIYFKKSLDNMIDKKQTHKKGDRLFTVYSENEHTSKQPILLDIYSKDEVTKNKYLQIRNHLLWKYPNCSISKKLVNSFIYFCSYEVVQLLSKESNDLNDTTGSENKSNSTNRDSKPLKDQRVTSHIDSTSIRPSYLKKPNQLIKDQINTKTSISKLIRDLSRRSWQHTSERETISIFILPEESTFIRSNDLNSYMEATRFILKIKGNSSNFVTSSATSSTIGADSVVDSTVTLLEKSSIKLSSINALCTIGNKCRISGSILLNNVQVDDESSLENVIIGPNAKIGKKSKLTNCYVEGNYIIDLKSNFKNEVLLNSYDEEDELEFDEYGSDAVYDSNSESDSGDDYDTESEEYYEDEEFEDDGLFER